MFWVILFETWKEWVWSLGHWVFWVIHYKNDRSFGFDHDHSRILCIHWVIWYFWPKWNVFWINYFLGLLVILEMCILVSFSHSKWVVIGSFGVFGHFVSFEIKSLVIGSFSVLVNPLKKNCSHQVCSHQFCSNQVCNSPICSHQISRIVNNST